MTNDLVYFQDLIFHILQKDNRHLQLSTTWEYWIDSLFSLPFDNGFCRIRSITYDKEGISAYVVVPNNSLLRNHPKKS